MDVSVPAFVKRGARRAVVTARKVGGRTAGGPRVRRRTSDSAGTLGATRFGWGLASKSEPRLAPRSEVTGHALRSRRAPAPGRAALRWR